MSFTPADEDPSLAILEAGELRCYLPELAVLHLRLRNQDCERGIGAASQAVHDHALGLFDDRPVLDHLLQAVDLGRQSGDSVVSEQRSGGQPFDPLVPPNRVRLQPFDPIAIRAHAAVLDPSGADRHPYGCVAERRPSGPPADPAPARQGPALWEAGPVGVSKTSWGEAPSTTRLSVPSSATVNRGI